MKDSGHYERARAVREVMDLFYALKSIKGTPRLKDLVKLAKRIKHPSPSHHWGSSFPYFGEVGEAAEYIGDFCVKWGRINVRQTKEKYGNVRVYCSFGWSQWHSIIYPKHAYNQFPDYLWQLDLKFSYSKVGHFFWKGVNRLAVSYHGFIYRLAHKRAISRWPMIREEILGSPDWDEYLKGL